VSSIYKNGEWWYYQTVLTLPDGSKRKIQTSLKTKDRKEGRRRQKDLDSKYLIDQIHLSSRVSLEETVDQFLVHRTKVCSHGDITQNTLRSDKGSLKVFLGFLKTCGVTYLNEFSDEDRGREIVEEFIDLRRSQKVSPNTIRRDLRHVSGFFKYCVQAPRRYLSRNPISSVSLPKASRKSRFPEQKDWETLRTYLRKQSKSPKVSLVEEILWFQIETGCRIGEILRLKWTREKTDLVGVGESWSVVEDNGSRIRLYSKKRERVIPLKELGEGRLTKHLQQKKNKGNLTTYVFPSPVTDLPLNISQFSRSFRRVLDTLKITKTFGTHGVRHGFISYLINNGVTSDQIGWLVGHSSSEITAIYSHVDERTLGSVLSRLG
jgi:integrase/recombinase XerD